MVPAKPPISERRPKKSRNSCQRLGNKHSSNRSDTRETTTAEVTTPSCASGSNRDILNCPICIEKFDELELRFHPCPCGYRVCAMCIHLIKEKTDGKCPNCRDDYDQRRCRVSDAIEDDLLVVLEEVKQEKNKEKNKENVSVRPARKPRSKPRKLPGYKSTQLPDLAPLDVILPPPPPPPVLQVRLTRFTGGISVWD